MAEPDHYWCLIPHDHDRHPRDNKPREYMWPIYLDDRCVFFPLEIQVTQDDAVKFFKERTKWRFHLLFDVSTAKKDFRLLTSKFPAGVPAYHMRSFSSKKPGILGIFTSAEDAMMCKMAWNPRDLS